MTRTARQWVTDAGIAALATGADLGFSVACARWHGGGHRQPDPFGMLLLGVNGLALLARRRYPVAVLGIVLGITLGAPALGASSAWCALIVAFFTAMLRGRRVAAIASLVIGYGASAWNASAQAALLLLAALVTLLSVAELSRALNARAVADRHRREEAAARRASEERLAIARDLHDVVAHSISVINVQANTALHLMDRQPNRAREALTAVREVSGQAEDTVIRVALADDQALVRSGFASLLGAEDDITVVGSVADGFAAVRLARERRPDVVLMDIRMPGLDGIAATREIARDPALAGVHVVILTTFGLDEYIFDALRAGAAGFLVKDTDAAELIRAVHVITAGDGLLSPTVTRRLIAEFAAQTRALSKPPGLDELTAREREVVGLVASGLSNDDIARRIYVSQSTVKTHVARAMTKLGARDRAQLVVIAYESALVRPGWSESPAP